MGGRGQDQVDEIEVLVRVAGLVAVLDEDGIRGRQLIGVREVVGGRQPHELSVQACFLAHLAERARDGVFVGQQVAARRYPLLARSMPVQQRSAAIDDERSGGEVANHASDGSKGGWVLVLAGGAVLMGGLYLEGR